METNKQIFCLLDALPLDIAYYLLHFFGDPHDVVALCVSSRVFAKLMRDCAFQTPIRILVKQRKTDREKKQLCRTQRQIRDEFNRRFGMSIDAFRSTFQQQIGVSPEIQACLLGLDSALNFTIN